jgi:hypothetical protein
VEDAEHETPVVERTSRLTVYVPCPSPEYTGYALPVAPEFSVILLNATGNICAITIRECYREDSMAGDGS